jgi:hypothetical protein
MRYVFPEVFCLVLAICLIVLTSGCAYQLGRLAIRKVIKHFVLKGDDDE